MLYKIRYVSENSLIIKKSHCILYQLDQFDYYMVGVFYMQTLMSMSALTLMAMGGWLQEQAHFSRAKFSKNLIGKFQC